MFRAKVSAEVKKKRLEIKREAKKRFSSHKDSIRAAADPVPYTSQEQSCESYSGA